MSEIKSGPRNRAPNFTKEEQLLLCKIAEAYSCIIESKKTDGVKQAQKQEAWHKIQEIYNSNTKGVPRTVENLLSCYRNMKNKIKKQHSGAKMVLQDPRKKEALINALEENGEDWNAVSLQISEPADVCESGYIEMQKALKKQDNRYKKSIMGTGGGPPPPPENDEALEKLKKIIEPQVDGLFTIYDGDALLMKQYQESVPDSEKIQPIESDIQCDVVDEVVVIPDIINKDNITTSPISTINRVDLLRKKKATPLHSADLTDNDHGLSTSSINTTPLSQSQVKESLSRIDILRKRKASALFNKENNTTEELSTKKCKTVNESFKILSEEKLELVRLQKLSLEMEIEHKQKIYEIELDNLLKKKEFNEQMYKKELLLKDLEIKKKQSEL